MMIDPCKDCGECCKIGESGAPMFMPHELALLPDVLAGQVGKRRAEYWNVQVSSMDPLKPCMWLMHDKRCREYERCPDVCRNFEPGCEACVKFRKRGGLPAFETGDDDD